MLDTLVILLTPLSYAGMCGSTQAWFLRSIPSLASQRVHFSFTFLWPFQWQLQFFFGDVPHVFSQPFRGPFQNRSAAGGSQAIFDVGGQDGTVTFEAVHNKAIRRCGDSGLLFTGDRWPWRGFLDPFVDPKIWKRHVFLNNRKSFFLLSTAAWEIKQKFQKCTYTCI